MSQNDLRNLKNVYADVLSQKAERAQSFAAAADNRPNLFLGAVAGAGAAIVGAVAWAIVTVVTHYQIGFMAIGIGFLVGIAMRVFGRGGTATFGVVGAVLALMGCVLGHFLSACGLAAVEGSVPIFKILLAVAADPSVVGKVLAATFSPMDLLFYAIAMFEGYKFSSRSAEE